MEANCQAYWIALEMHMKKKTREKKNNKIVHLQYLRIGGVLAITKRSILLALFYNRHIHTQKTANKIPTTMQNKDEEIQFQ